MFKISFPLFFLLIVAKAVLLSLESSNLTCYCSSTSFTLPLIYIPRKGGMRNPCSGIMLLAFVHNLSRVWSIYSQVTLWYFLFDLGSLSFFLLACYIMNISESSEDSPSPYIFFPKHHQMKIKPINFHAMSFGTNKMHEESLPISSGMLCKAFPSLKNWKAKHQGPEQPKKKKEKEIKESKNKTIQGQNLQGGHTMKRVLGQYLQALYISYNQKSLERWPFASFEVMLEELSIGGKWDNFSSQWTEVVSVFFIDFWYLIRVKLEPQKFGMFSFLFPRFVSWEN